MRAQPATQCPLSKGLAFEVADLILAESWSKAHALKMVVRIDHGVGVNEDYEEVLMFESKKSPFDQLILWRDAKTVFVQPLLGKAKHHGSVAAALESLRPQQHVTVTDITATAWVSDK